ncbi:hypothetical protein EJ03DRAFT_326673 [Teratosphaeria nubilosa]|uniref:Secreted protein n=1 Tax=Teratosphaeria nubilosa TaxID=161662 RepID=A0A6G1LCI1_9PEZI|nr:hypothetical protein EJ03DRAFT_326673 [Teratosphaeria nubilosa]
MQKIFFAFCVACCEGQLVDFVLSFVTSPATCFDSPRMAVHTIQSIEPCQLESDTKRNQRTYFPSTSTQNSKRERSPTSDHPPPRPLSKTRLLRSLQIVVFQLQQPASIDQDHLHLSKSRLIEFGV